MAKDRGGGVESILENTNVTFLRIPSVSSYSQGSVMPFPYLAGLSARIRKLLARNLTRATGAMRVCVRISLSNAKWLAQALKL